MEYWREQLKLLGIFHWVVAGITALLSLIPIVHIVLGVMFLRGTLPEDPGEQLPAPFAWLMIAIGSLLIMVGLAFSVLLALAGRHLQQRRHWTFCIVMAALASTLFPFGTLLGVFTIIVLTKPEVQVAFGRPITASPMQVAPTPS